MFKILALDGGGIRGAFTAAVLDHFESQLGAAVISNFDLTVGTSTGGIIALGLASGRRAKDLLCLYKDEGEQIFPAAKTGWTGLLNSIFAPKFSNEELKKILLKYLPDHPFAQLPYAVAITSFDAACAQPVVFKSKYHPSLTAFSDVSVIDVALATSAAPTYFAAAQTDCGVMIDGGIWANCPVMVGITEALSLFAQRIDNVYVLSIGTTSIPRFVRRDERDGGVLHWARPAPSLLMHAAKLGAIGQAKKLCKELVRVDEVVDPDRFSLDDSTQVDDLAQLGSTVGRRVWSKVRSIFFVENSWSEIRHHTNS